MMTNIILIGPQGSGKSTQAQILVDKYNYQLVSTGNLIRNLAASEQSHELRNIINQGKLIPDKILFNKILEPYLSKLKQNKPIIFDGIPRNKEQIKLFKKLLNKNNIQQPYLIHLTLSDREVYKRILARKICPKCKTNYKPDQKEYLKNKCSKCHTALTVREDDNITSLKQRLAVYHDKTSRVIDYFKQNNHYINIDGSKSIQSVTKTITDKINKLNDYNQ